MDCLTLVKLIFDFLSSNLEVMDYFQNIQTIKTCPIDQMNEADFLKACMNGGPSADPRIVELDLGRTQKPKSATTSTATAKATTTSTDGFKTAKKEKTDDELYPMDLKSTANYYEIWLDVPGYNRDGISFYYLDKYLTIEGLITSIKKVADLAISHRNSKETFTRTIKLNTPIIVNGIYKEVKDGVLYLRIPKI